MVAFSRSKLLILRISTSLLFLLTVSRGRVSFYANYRKKKEKKKKSLSGDWVRKVK